MAEKLSNTMTAFVKILLTSSDSLKRSVGLTAVERTDIILAELMRCNAIGMAMMHSTNRINTVMRETMDGYNTDNAERLASKYAEADCGTLKEHDTIYSN